MKHPPPTKSWPPAVDGRVLFGSLLLLEVLHLCWLILRHRIPIGHDGFEYFSLQYFFLNDSAVNHEIPLWIPYVSQGEPSGWWYTIQGTVGLLGSSLLLLGKAIMGINFLNIFHYGIFVDRLLLLTGVWLLGRYYFESALTRFFVASCVMASCVTMSQFKFTLHLYYALPLLFYFGHTFLQTGRWRYLFGSCSLFAMQTIGNDAYFIPVASLTVFLYFLFYFLDQPALGMKQFKSLRWGPSALISIIGSAACLGVVGALFISVKDNYLVNLNLGRSPDGGVPLDVFLSYAGNMDFAKWRELYFRISPVLDYTVYFGFLALPLVLLGCLFNSSRKKNPLILLALLLFLFSMGTYVSVFFYYTWPLMKFYRHLALVAPVIKLFLIFIAGFGFEFIFIQRPFEQKRRWPDLCCLLAGASLLNWSIIVIDLGMRAGYANALVSGFATPLLAELHGIFKGDLTVYRFYEAGMFSMLFGCLFLLWPLIPSPKYGRYFLLVLLSVHSTDLGGYYCAQMSDRTFSLNSAQRKITFFTALPYSKRRGTALTKENPRGIFLFSPLRGYTQYVTTNAFLFQDALATPYRTDYRPRPLQELIDALKGPVLKNKTFLKMAGSTGDKIQFFKKAYFVKDESRLRPIFNRADFQGDMLFVSSPLHPDPRPPSARLNQDDRLRLPYNVRLFTANVMEISVDAPLTGPIWMMYADNWHPCWRARVNGQPAAIYKADLAYKAVKLVPGKNVVRFEFYSPKILLLIRLTAVMALGWLLILLFLTVRILTRPPQIILPLSNP